MRYVCFVQWIEVLLSVPGCPFHSVRSRGWGHAVQDACAANCAATLQT